MLLAADDRGKDLHSIALVQDPLPVSLRLVVDGDQLDLFVNAQVGQQMLQRGPLGQLDRGCPPRFAGQALAKVGKELDVHAHGSTRTFPSSSVTVIDTSIIL